MRARLERDFERFRAELPADLRDVIALARDLPVVSAVVDTLRKELPITALGLQSSAVGVAVAGAVAACGWWWLDVTPPAAGPFLVAVLVGAAAFVTLGVAASTFVTRVEAAPAVTNLVLWPTAFLSGTFAYVEPGTVLHRADQSMYRTKRTHQAEQADRAGWAFPYLVDDTQEVGRAYGAACTPDFFLYDARRRLAYRGAYDGSTPGNGVPLTGDLLRDAITRALDGQPVPEPHRPSMGCSIKWRD